MACQLLAETDRPLALFDAQGSILALNADFERLMACEIGQKIDNLTPTPSALTAWMAQDDKDQFLDLNLATDDDLVPFQVSKLRVAGPEVYLLAPHSKEPGSLGHRRMMDRLDVGFWDLDVPTNAFRATETWRRIRGLPADAVIDVSTPAWTEAIHEDDRQNLIDLYEAQRVGDVSVVNVQYRHAHPDKGWVWVLCRASVLERDSKGNPVRIIGIDTEISDLKARESESINLAEKLQLAVEASGLGVFEFDPGTLTTIWDDRMLEIYGVEDGINKRPKNDWDTFLHPDDRENMLALSEECDRLGLDLASDYRIVRPSGEVRYIRAQSRRVRSPALGERLIGVNIDITEDMRRTKELEEARNLLRYESLHDPLTGLGNRRHLDQTMATFSEKLEASDGFVVVAIDLDYFKELNDRFGHAAGDEGLLRVARVLDDLMPSDAQSFRVGGDEFMTLIRSAPSDAAMAALCTTLIEHISKPFQYDGDMCRLGASIGFARGSGQAEDISKIFVEADAALYAAKNAGRMCFRAFESIETPSLIRRLISDREFSEALENGEITCMYQPQFDARSLALVGAEALVRWKCRERGIVSPGNFLSQAAKAGCLPEIDRTVFCQVLEQQSKWHAGGIPYPRISVNVSKERLFHETFCRDLKDVLAPHHQLSIELLETAFYDHMTDDLAFRTDAIRDAGIPLEIDDFGTGHASILALQTLHPDRIKFDRALVKSATSTAAGEEILKALIRVARLKKAEVLLEGIEDHAVLAAVSRLDCDALQGYHLGRPMPADAFQHLLQDQRVTSA
ncbi:MAG: EAL domain-containing protein [Pseudomonadota bacterium]